MIYCTLQTLAVSNILFALNCRIFNHLNIDLLQLHSSFVRLWVMHGFLNIFAVLPIC